MPGTERFRNIALALLVAGGTACAADDFRKYGRQMLDGVKIKPKSNL